MHNKYYQKEDGTSIKKWASKQRSKLNFKSKSRILVENTFPPPPQMV